MSSIINPYAFGESPVQFVTGSNAFYYSETSSVDVDVTGLEVGDRVFFFFWAGSAGGSIGNGDGGWTNRDSQGAGSGNRLITLEKRLTAGDIGASLVLTFPNIVKRYVGRLAYRNSTNIALRDTTNSGASFTYGGFLRASAKSAAIAIGAAERASGTITVTGPSAFTGRGLQTVGSTGYLDGVFSYDKVTGYADGEDLSWTLPSGQGNYIMTFELW